MSAPQISDPPRLSERHLANARIVPDRTAMLPHFPKGGTIVEVGVALGTFSQLLIEICQPEHFIAIDLFGIHRQDSLWGRSTQEIFQGKTHEEYYRDQVERLPGKHRLTVLHGDSADQLETLADDSVDIFYVDADHSYEASSAELRIIKRKIKHTGLICMNDYVLFDNVGSGSPYGVIQATNEFMISEAWEMVFFALQPQMYCDVVIRKIPD